MAGSAAVLGAARAIAAIEPAGVEVHFIVASCENMINGAQGLPVTLATRSHLCHIES